MSEAALAGPGPLRLSLTRQADRYAHAIEYVEHGRVLWRLTTVEGRADEDWPASPALQDLRLEQRDGQQLALLVGQAGRSHWSLSAELDSAAACLILDVACRVRGQPDRLGSQYQIFPEAESGDIWRPPGGALLAIEQVDGHGADIRIEAGERLSIAPGAVTGPWPRTVRWRYAVRCPG